MSSKTSGTPDPDLIAVLDRLRARFGSDNQTTQRVGVTRANATTWRQGKTKPASATWQRLLALDRGEGAMPMDRGDVMRRYVEARNRLEAIFLSGDEENWRFVERVFGLLNEREAPATRERRGKGI